MTFLEYLLSITTEKELEYLKGKVEKCDVAMNAKNTKLAQNSANERKPT